MKKGRSGRDSTKDRTILVVEDDEALANLVQRRLRRAGFHTKIFLRGAEGVDWLTKNYATLLLLDYSLPDMTGKEVVEALHMRRCRVPFIVCTGRGDENIAVSMMKLGARDYLVKDGTFLDRLPQAVRLAIQALETERRLAEAEKALQESEEEYRCVFENNATATAIIAKDMTFSKINPEFEKVTGYSMKEVEGKLKLTDFIGTGNLKWIKEQDRKGSLKRERRAAEYETRWVDKQGDTRHLIIRVSKISHVRKWVASIEDVTTRKKVERELRESKERLRKFADEACFEGIVIHDGDRILDSNRRYCDMFGYPCSEVIGMKVYETIASENREKVRKQISDGYELPYSAFGLRRDGSTFPIEIHARKIPFHGKTVRAAAVRDMSEQIKASECLRREEEKFRVLLEECPVGVSLVGKNGDHKYVNPKFVEITGYTLEDIQSGRASLKGTDPEGGSPNEPIPSEIKNSREHSGGEPQPQVFTVRSKDGSEKLIQTRSATLGSGDRLIIHEDVTSRKRLEAQLRQAQKIEAIGTLAGGIAHDFNNLLMGIQGRTSIILMDADPSHPHFEDLRAIEEYVTSAADLTKQLLGLARGGKYEVKAVNPVEVVDKCSRMFGRAKKEIAIHTRYAEDTWIVEVDRTQIEQVILNLFVNAWQAMPEGGRVYVDVRNVTVDRKYPGVYPVRDGEYVEISVTDTGVGMDEATRQRIFDPFFTTKETGRGTGLGLASAYGIIRNHGGFIDVRSAKNEGATFRVYLPACKKKVVKDKALPERMMGGAETVLLVDDEEMIIDVGKRILESLGYQVLVARGGEEAVRVLKKTKEKVDLVILDMVMPGMDGGRTYDALKQIKPDIKTLLSTGYSTEGLASEILERGCEGIIQKPFNMTDFSRKIRSVLRRG